MAMAVEASLALIWQWIRGCVVGSIPAGVGVASLRGVARIYCYGGTAILGKSMVDQR